ncbi:zinc finger protein OZF-like [Malaya genurostris]|uniref:zinc finger protein OZF-like n=1 Tax=Malaya genurostris TaxID=325434 RepID=UPI0026F3834B|nr:zinc finger protein OZF-like [Malaya genurostris]
MASRLEPKPLRSDICRICMANSASLVSVFAQFEDVLIARIIQDCTSVMITENDGLPENICTACLTQLENFVRFIRKARTSDQALRKLFQSEQEAENENACEPIFEKVALNASADDLDDDAKSMSADNSDSEVEQEISSNEIEAEDTISNDDNMDELESETYQIIHIDRGKSLCCSCLEQFENNAALESHVNKIHTDGLTNSNKKFQCTLCNRKYSSETAVRAHNRRMENLCKIYQCKKCGVKISDHHRRRKHARSHLKKRSSKTEKTPPTLEELMEKYGRLCCALGCVEFFETDEQLQAHAHSVHKANKVEATLAYNEGKPVECSVCFKRFKDGECLQRHLRFKYMPSKNVCTLCGAKFPSLSSLTIHERSHTKEKPFQCEICSKAFGDKQSLKRHHVKHSNEKPFMCSVCGVSFKRKRAMQSHMIIHEPGQLPFKCEMCEKRFRVKAKMLYHLRTHTGERPYSCRYCDKSFADFSNRMRHELSHTGEKPYKCSHCSAGFITRRFMLEHQKNHQRSQVK